MATNTAGSIARQDPRQVTNTIRVNIPAGVAAGPMTSTNGLQIGVLPQGCYVTAIESEVSTVFTGSPTFGLGTDGPPTNMISAGVTNATTPLAAAASKHGRIYAAAADTPVFLKFSAAAAAGVLDIVIEFEGNFPG